MKAEKKIIELSNSIVTVILRPKNPPNADNDPVDALDAALRLAAGALRPIGNR